MSWVRTRNLVQRLNVIFLSLTLHIKQSTINTPPWASCQVQKKYKVFICLVQTLSGQYFKRYVKPVSSFKQKYFIQIIFVYVLFAQSGLTIYDILYIQWLASFFRLFSFCDKILSSPTGKIFSNNGTGLT